MVMHAHAYSCARLCGICDVDYVDPSMPKNSNPPGNSHLVKVPTEKNAVMRFEFVSKSISWFTCLFRVNLLSLYYFFPNIPCLPVKHFRRVHRRKACIDEYLLHKLLCTEEYYVSLTVRSFCGKQKREPAACSSLKENFTRICQLLTDQACLLREKLASSCSCFASMFD